MSCYSDMMKKVNIPIFPLNILPLRGEMIPLHIFEERYRDLLEDTLQTDQGFGILYVSPANKHRLGTIVKPISVIKKYKTGESDIVVRGGASFMMSKYYRYYKDKLYAGGDVFEFDSLTNNTVGEDLLENYADYCRLIEQRFDMQDITIHDIAGTINLDTTDRMKYLMLLNKDKKERFLTDRLRYKHFILQQEIKYKNSFALN